LPGEQRPDQITRRLSILFLATDIPEQSPL